MENIINKLGNLQSMKDGQTHRRDKGKFPFQNKC